MTLDKPPVFIVYLAEVIDRDGDIDAFNRIPGHANSAHEVSSDMSRPCIPPDGCQALGDMLTASAGIELIDRFTR
ncbi:MAG: hypothetical protein PHG48_08885, partial [Eubacteriales bacterium]|nr:hypothetical protein [Eubacteriales bacterium]